MLAKRPAKCEMVKIIDCTIAICKFPRQKNERLTIRQSAPMYPYAMSNP